ncbi:response regulator [Actinoallomurus rhizosphaericola]|uniref:response regulator n=1 Tax=Actinoallomurus rhizosphaericola TaxID=2952536 RepID=UPI00209248D9|nr:response regulator transcription factor [Actinoallomurus rhizosphaericola]MCO5997784.1 response regulator transcription factor [Actinoallomurus rhizosphaericola]
MRVFICDDHAVFADSLAVVLREKGHDVVGVVYSPEAALRLLPGVRADVCLIDLRFPTGSVLGSLPELVAAVPGTRFVVLTGSTDPGTVETGLAAGVRGFAHKGQQAGEIVDLLARVHAGEVVVDPETAGRLPARPRTEAQRLANYLTPREREVLTRLVRGENTATLARGMEITRSTARSHVQSVLTKLGVHSQREAVIVAARHGLVSVSTGEWLLP